MVKILPPAKIILQLVSLLVSLAFAKAANVGDLSFERQSNTYKITSCDPSASGTLEIPETVDGILVTGINSSAFQSCQQLIHVTLPDTIKTIDSAAFAYCTNLETIKLSKSLIYLGERAFLECSKLLEISLPNTPLHVEREAFKLCNSLTIANLGDGIKNLEDSVFERCVSLTSVEFGANVENIFNGAFLGCSSLKNLYLPPTLKRIGDFAFAASGLESCDIPNSVETLGLKAFMNCFGLREASIGSGIKEFRDEVFVGCRSLSTVSLSEGLETIGRACFAGNGGRMEINFPNSLKSIGTDAFSPPPLQTEIIISGDFGLFYVTSNSSAFLIDAIANGWTEGDGTGRLDISETFDGKPIKSANAFMNLTILRKLTLPNTIDHLGPYALTGCTQLEELHLPSGLRSIGRSALARCSSLQQLDVPHTVTSIGDTAFAACSSLTAFEIPSTLRHLQSFTFGNCTSLRRIDIPDSVISIEDYVFKDCTSLDEITFGDNLESIGSSTFQNTQIEPYHDPASSLKFLIGSTSAFLIDGSLARGPVEIPESVQGRPVICISGFLDNRHITSVTFPSSTRTIADSAFKGCIELTELKIPEGVETIKAHAFSHCLFLSEVSLPDSLLTVEEQAFFNSARLDNVNFGQNLSYIGDYAFLGCRTLKNIVFPGPAPEIGSQIVRSSSFTQAIYVAEPHADSFGGENARWNGWRVIVRTNDVEFFASSLSNWTHTSIGSSSQLSSVASGSGIIIAASKYRRAFFVSTDMDNWEEVRVGLAIENLIFDGSQFLAVGSIYRGPDLGNSGAMMASTDGSSWRLLKSSDFPLNDIAYGNNTWIACGADGTLLRSTDRSNWDSISAGSSSNWISVEFGNGKFLLATNEDASAILSSTDGLTWTDISASSGESSQNIASPLVHRGFRFLGSGASETIYYSENGRISFRDTQASRQNIRAFSFGNGVYLALGQSFPQFSVDAETWFPLTPLSTDLSLDITFHDGRFVAVGNNGSVWKSAPIAPLPGYRGWRQTHFPNAPASSNLHDDFDSDNVTNLFEYATGSDPRDPNDSSSATPSITNGNLSVVLPRNPTALDVTAIGERSSDLQFWTPANVERIDLVDDRWEFRITGEKIEDLSQYIRVTFQLDE